MLTYNTFATNYVVGKNNFFLILWPEPDYSSSFFGQFSRIQTQQHLTGLSRQNSEAFYHFICRFDYKHCVYWDQDCFGNVLWNIYCKCDGWYFIWCLLITGYRMPAPNGCPDEIYALMRHCWQHDPRMRPSFLKIRAELHALCI